MSFELSDDEGDKFIKLIDKASSTNIDLKPLVKYFKKSDLTFLIENEWNVESVIISIPPNELLEFIEKSNGVTDKDISNKWPLVKQINWPITNLSYAQKIIIRTINGETYYISKDKINEFNKRNIKQEEIKIEEVKIETPKESFKPVPLTKSECKSCRMSIFNIATLEDISIGGFKPEFVEKLSEKEKSYIIKELDAFKTKLLMTEIKKKFSNT
jgi:hypothetical protein